MNLLRFITRDRYSAIDILIVSFATRLSLHGRFFEGLVILIFGLWASMIASNLVGHNLERQP